MRHQARADTKGSDRSLSGNDELIDDLRQSYETIGPIHKVIKTQFGVASGNCLPASSLVYTNPEGPKQVLALRPGDHVLSFEGEIVEGPYGKRELLAKLVPKKVVGVQSNGVKPVYEVKTRTRRIRATGNHPILAATASLREGHVRRTHKYSLRLEWKPVDQLKVGSALVCVRKIQDFDDVAPHLSDDMMKLFGCFVGDGYIERHGAKLNGITLCLPRNDKNRSKYEKIIRSELNLNYTIDKRDGWLHIYSKALAEKFVSLGFDHMALAKVVPGWVFAQPLLKRQAFIEGYLDSDGNHNHGNWRFETPNATLIEQIRQLCISVGYRVTNTYLHRSEHSGIFFNGRPFHAQPSYAFAVIRPEGKSRQFTGNETRPVGRGLTTEHFYIEPVVSMKLLPSEETYDIEVEGSHNFVADGLVVHNTRLAAVPTWPVLEKTVENKYEHIKLEVAANLHDDKPAEWWEARINEAAAELVKMGAPKETISQRLLKDFPLSEKKILRYLHEEYKHPEKVRAGKVSAEARMEKRLTAPEAAFRAPPVRGNPANLGFSLPGGSSGYSVTMSEYRTRTYTPQELRLQSAFSGKGFDLSFQHPVPMDKFKCGKCVKPGTVILGDNLPIESLTSGGTVASDSGLSHVTDTFQREYHGNMLQVKAAGLLPFEVTPEHPLFIVRKSWGKIEGKWAMRRYSLPEWKEAKDIQTKQHHRVGDCLLIPRTRGTFDLERLDLKPFAKKITRTGPLSIPLNEDIAWLFGLYVAEGCSGKMLCLGHHETVLQDRAVAIVKSIGYSAALQRTRTSTIVIMSSRVMRRAFLEWCGKNAKMKQMPDFILYHKSDSIVKAFLEGYEQGDGCIDKKGWHHMGTVSRVLVMQLQLALARLGRPSSIYMSKGGTAQIEGRKVFTSDIYRINYKLGLKHNAMVKVTDQYLVAPIQSVTKNHYDGPVYNIETSDHTYLISNAVTHNCRQTWIEEPPLKCPKDGTQVERLSYHVDILATKNLLKFALEPGKLHDFDSTARRDEFLRANGIEPIHVDNDIIDAGGAYLVLENAQLRAKLGTYEEHTIAFEGYARHVAHNTETILKEAEFYTTTPAHIKVIVRSK